MDLLLYTSSLRLRTIFRYKEQPWKEKYGYSILLSNVKGCVPHVDFTQYIVKPPKSKNSSVNAKDATWADTKVSKYLKLEGNYY